MIPSMTAAGEVKIQQVSAVPVSTTSSPPCSLSQHVWGRSGAEIGFVQPTQTAQSKKAQ